MSLVQYITDFADQAVLLPMVAAITFALAAQGWRRGALAWLGAVSATFAVMLALKLVFLACSPVLWPMGIHSPSGHVAAATVVAGGLAMLLRRRPGILPTAALAGMVIAISRLLLYVHSLPEVVLGAAVGLAGTAALVRLAGPVPQLKAKPLVAAVVLTAFVFHGLRLPAEIDIRFVAHRATRLLDVCRPHGKLPQPQDARR